MNKFILEFEHLCNKMKEHDLVPPNNVLTFKLLDSANLRGDDRKLALTLATDLKFESMKSALKRIFTTPSSAPSPLVKKEEIFFNKSSKSKSRPNKNSTKQSNVNKLNLLDKNGKISRCVICDSKMHWAGKCPHQNESVNMFEAEDSESENSDSEEVNIVLLTDSDLKNDIFVAEALKLAVIDTACTKRVVREEWYKDFVKNLPIKYKNRLHTSTANTAFKFGDGHKVYSFKKVRISANMGGTECFIDVEIVKEKIPLLLSKQSLKNAQAVIDVANDKVSVFDKMLTYIFLLVDTIA